MSSWVKVNVYATVMNGKCIYIFKSTGWGVTTKIKLHHFIFMLLHTQDFILCSNCCECLSVVSFSSPLLPISHGTSVCYKAVWSQKGCSFLAVTNSPNAVSNDSSQELHADPMHGWRAAGSCLWCAPAGKLPQLQLQHLCEVNSEIEILHVLCSAVVHMVEMAAF